jgi:hypothetical protein
MSTQRPNPKKAIAASVRAAELLTTIGTLVEVVRDVGPTTFTWTTSEPWPLGHGAMVIKLQGISGAYDCARVTPLDRDQTKWTEITFEDQGADFTRWFLEKDRVAWCDFHGCVRAMRQVVADIAASYKAAQKLDTIGMPVVVTRDNGQLEHTKLLSLPWTLGSGHWVAIVEGIRGGYDCARIAPVVEMKRRAA